MVRRSRADPRISPRHVRPTTAQVMAQIRRTYGPIDTRHRIVVGERLRDEGGNVVGNQGFYVDVTPRAVCSKTSRLPTT
jgi:hypothetical protein